VRFGRHDPPEPDDQDVEVDVDLQLERDITSVERATGAYLGNPSEKLRQELLSALEALDEQTSASDSYEQSVVDSAVFGFTSKGRVIGETSQNPLAEELPGSLFRAQVLLVKAAKAAVTDPGPSTLDGLRSASSSLAALQPAEQEGDHAEGP
jgi:hypothetical protein